MHFPETARVRLAILKTKALVSFHPPRHLPTILAKTTNKFQYCLLGTSVEHGVASYCPISIVTNWLSHTLQVAASRCVN